MDRSQALGTATDRPAGLPFGAAVALCLAPVRSRLPGHLALLLLSGAVPLAGLHAMRLLIDAVATGLADRTAATSTVLLAVGWAAGIGLVGVALRAWSTYRGEQLARLVTDDAVTRLQRRVATLDLARFDDPGFHDALHKAGQEAGARPARLLQDLGAWLVALVMLLTMVWTLGTVAVWLPLLAMVAAVPIAWARQAQSRAQFAWQERHSHDQRQAIYFGSVLASQHVGKDTRALGLWQELLARVTALRGALRASALRLAHRRAWLDVGVQGIASLAMFGAYAFLANEALAGEITIGVLVMQAQAVQRAQNGVRDLLGARAALVEDRLFLRHLATVLALPATVAPPTTPPPMPGSPAGLGCANVTFGYPGSQAPVLRDFTLQLRPGEHVALVGRNGSGKSTVVKLLARLYDPAAGTVTFGGVDVRELDPEATRARLGVLFQDSAPLELTLRENLRWSAPDADEAAMREALDLAGLTATIAGWPQGLDTVLGRRLGDGRELSVGEARKVALARVLVRQADVLVLDEPAAFLDPPSVRSLFQELRVRRPQCALLIVDHRAAALAHVDRVAVLDGGRIVESGTLAQLQAGGATFRALFAR